MQGGPNRFLGLILVGFLALALVYSWLMPPWEAPDEPAHYLLALNLARIGLFSNTEANYEAHQPQPYYRLASIPLRWMFEDAPESVARYSPDPNFNNLRKPVPVYPWTGENYRFLPGLYTLRWLNILVGAFAVALNYSAMRLFLPDDQLVVPAAILLTAFLPQFLHMSSSVNNDAIGALAGAFLFWLLGQLLVRERRQLVYVLSVTIAVLLPLVTKLTVAPVSFAVLLSAAVRTRVFNRPRWGRILVVFAGMYGLLFALALALPETGAMWLRVMKFRLFGWDPASLSLQHFGEMLVQLFRSFWGQVGWLGVGLPWGLSAGLTGLAVLGTAACLLRIRSDVSGRLAWAWGVAAISVLAVLRNGLLTDANQGRFLFPGLGALALVSTAGWSRLLPARFHSWLPWLAAVLMLILNVWLIFRGIIPVYFQPFLDR